MLHETRLPDWSASLSVTYISPIPIVIAFAGLLVMLGRWGRERAAKSAALQAHVADASRAFKDSRWADAAAVGTLASGGPPSDDPTKRHALLIVGLAQIKHGAIEEAIASLELLGELLRADGLTCSTSEVLRGSIHSLLEPHIVCGSVARARALLTEADVDIETTDNTPLRVLLLAREQAWDRVVEEVRAMTPDTEQVLSIQKMRLIHLLHRFALENLAHSGFRQAADAEHETIPAGAGLPRRGEHAELAKRWPDLRACMDQLGLIKRGEEPVLRVRPL